MTCQVSQSELEKKLLEVATSHVSKPLLGKHCDISLTSQDGQCNLILILAGGSL